MDDFYAIACSILITSSIMISVLVICVRRCCDKGRPERSNYYRPGPYQETTTSNFPMEGDGALTGIALASALQEDSSQGGRIDDHTYTSGSHFVSHRSDSGNHFASHHQDSNDAGNSCFDVATNNDCGGDSGGGCDSGGGGSCD